MTDTAPAATASPTAGPEALSSQPPPRPKALSLRKNFGWALTGNLIYQASQWLNLIILAKLLDVAEVGRFALAMAICTPITTFSALNLRAVQVTDARDQHQFGHFLAVQLVMSLLAVLAITTIALFWGYDSQTAWVISVVGLGQAVLVIRDVFIACNQKHERMDTVALSKGMMGILSLAALGIGVCSTGSLLVGVIALQGAKLAIFVLWDIPATHRLIRACLPSAPQDYLRPTWDAKSLLRLVGMALPLGLSAVFVSLSSSLPRLVIERTLGLESLGYFSVIMALVMAGNQVTAAASHSALPRLSRYWLENRRAYRRILLRLVGLGGVLGCAGLLLVWIAGREMLALFFGPAYVDQYHLFLYTMLFGMIAFVVTFLDAAFVAIRRFRSYAFAKLALFVTVTVTAFLAIPVYGLPGAIHAFMAGYLTFAICALVFICLSRRQHHANP